MYSASLAVTHLEVGRVEVALIAGCLELLVDPDLGLIAVALKQLPLVALLQALAPDARPLVQRVATAQQLQRTNGGMKY
jgi:hypothetical protein